MDLLGSGYSSKPSPTSAEARAISGENGRDLTPSVSRLGTAWGGSREGVEVVLQHPLGSVYNFYTWAEQVADFTKEVVRDDKVTLVCNSIGTMTALQAALDCPDIFRGVLVVNPNFRELHAAEVPSFALPAIRAVQRLLRERGHGLFNALAKPDTVKQILKEPYYDPTDVTPLAPPLLLGHAHPLHRPSMNPLPCQ